MKNKIPTVAIIGRPNVGKSTLFNRLIQKRVSITLDKEGITRDRIFHKCEWLGKKFNLIDTGGFNINLNLEFQAEINKQIEIAISESEIIIFLLSQKDGITKGDNFVKNNLKRIKNKKIIVAINKSDNRDEVMNSYNYYQLGFGEPIAISSIHGIGISDLLDKIISLIPESDYIEEEKITRIGIIGKPNVGKSTLLNAFLNDSRVIVSPIAGTTRDAIDTKIQYQNKEYILTDTAGIKKNKQSLEDVEWYAELRSKLSIYNSDIILLLVDPKQSITFIDEKIMGFLKDELKPTILVINKVDEVSQEQKLEIIESIKQKFKFSPWVSYLFISALNKKNINSIYGKVENIEIALNQKISINKLNSFLADIQLIKKVQRYNGILVKLTYITYKRNSKFPHFIIFSNHPDKIHFSYKRFIENQLRIVFDFEGIPIKLSFKKKDDEKKW